ncbi:MAG: response regulator transcription factor [Bacteriovoracaceae bacterium]|nr:response regulator transcription factor [Bacteriovoracaceae bacterium]
MSAKKAKVLIIEDERHIAEGLKLNLELAGHQVELAANGRIGLEKWQEFKPHLIILDIMMPELDGHGVLEKIRSIDLRLPILILSAKNASVDKVKAFKGGVDDYLGKPFSLEELMLRVDRLLLRSSWGEDTAKTESIVSFGPNRVDLILMKANTLAGDIDLTEQEVKVLELFFANPQRPLNRNEILEAGWGYSEDIFTRTLDNFMVRFRKYFEEDPKKPKYFCSVRGVGYLFSPEGLGR